jgi:hypothetical protein
LVEAVTVLANSKVGEDEIRVWAMAQARLYGIPETTPVEDFIERGVITPVRRASRAGDAKSAGTRG